MFGAFPGVLGAFPDMFGGFPDISVAFPRNVVAFPDTSVERPRNAPSPLERLQGLFYRSRVISQDKMRPFRWFPVILLRGSVDKKIIAWPARVMTGPVHRLSGMHR